MNFYPTVSPYVGAKAMLAAEMARLFYYWDIKEYYSLFAGMINDIIQAPLNGMKIYASDYDKGICCLLEVLCNFQKGQVLYDQMLMLDYSEDTFNKAKEKIEDRDKLMLIPDEIERARYMWTALLLSKNGQMKQFKGIKDGLEQEKYQTMMINKYRLLDYISGIIIENDDAVNIINRLKKTSRTNIFCYADPPYYGENCSVKKHYKFDLETYDGQKRLLDAAKDVPFKMMFSNYDNDLYNQVLVNESGWYRYEFKEVYKSMRMGGAGIPRSRVMEMIWTNYDLEELK